MQRRESSRAQSSSSTPTCWTSFDVVALESDGHFSVQRNVTWHVQLAAVRIGAAFKYLVFKPDALAFVHLPADDEQLALFIQERQRGSDVDMQHLRSETTLLEAALAWKQWRLLHLARHQDKSI